MLHEVKHWVRPNSFLKQAIRIPWQHTKAETNARLLIKILFWQTSPVGNICIYLFLYGPFKRPLPAGSHITQTESMWSLRCINPASLSQKHANYGHSWLTTSQILNTTHNVGHLLTTRHPICPQILDSVVVFYWDFWPQRLQDTLLVMWAHLLWCWPYPWSSKTWPQSIKN